MMPWSTRTRTTVYIRLCRTFHNWAVHYNVWWLQKGTIRFLINISMQHHSAQWPRHPLLNAQPRERKKNKKENKVFEFSSHMWVLLIASSKWNKPVVLRFGGILWFCLLRITQHGALIYSLLWRKFDLTLYI